MEKLDTLLSRIAVRVSAVNEEVMGPTEETCRQCLIGKLADIGLTVVGRTLKHGARMTLRKII